MIKFEHNQSYSLHSCLQYFFYFIFIKDYNTSRVKFFLSSDNGNEVQAGTCLLGNNLVNSTDESLSNKLLLFIELNSISYFEPPKQ